MVGAHAEEFRRCRVLRVFQITGVIPAIRAKRCFGTPYVTTYGFWYGQLSQLGPKRVLKTVVERLGLRHAAAVIATTEELRARAARLAPRVELIPNGVDLRLFRPMDGERSPGRRILYVGRLSERISRPSSRPSPRSATARLRRGGRRSTALISTPAPTTRCVRGFLGVVEQSSYRRSTPRSDVFVLASFTEGHPKVLLEAMACGLPCVASDCAGNRSLIIDGETGLLFDPYRPAELAARLRQIFADRALAARLAKAAREMIVARYDLSALVAREIALVGAIAER
jgi:glycosyltransferase involved in cell wall biosynthesis